jgi:3',5'-cyclic-AMP phosphodiesterase
VLIAQATDIHIGFDRGNPEEANVQRLRAVIDRMVNGPNRPDLLLLTGDLTEWGDEESFARLAAEVRHCPFPVYPMAGNHDLRDELVKAFPGTPLQDGFVQYAIEHNGLRLLMLDTVLDGQHSGAFCETRAAWLATELAAHPQTPTLIVMHHPTIVVGIDWMDPNPQAEWIRRFAGAIRGHSQIVGILTGHVHRTILGSFEGITVSICQSVAPRVALNLNLIDPEVPDGRDLITDELPAWGLHRWDGTSLVSHFESVGSLTALARYDEKLQPLIRGIMAERPGAIFPSGK